MCTLLDPARLCYSAAGKLFPGPHLYAGAGIVALWAVAASLVPAMQKGNDTARTVHITLNCVNIALFAWQVANEIASCLQHCCCVCSNVTQLACMQVPTGLEIVGKVLQFTSLP